MKFEKLKKLLGAGILAAPDVYEAITAQQIKSRELGINQRTLSYWRKEGLFIFDTDFEKHEHIRFSFIEYVWLNIVAKLREYEIALDVIRTIKEGLTFKIHFSEIIKNPESVNRILGKLPEKERGEALDVLHDPEAIKQADRLIKFNVLLLLILESIIYNCHISLLVNIEGDFFPMKFDDIEKFIEDEDFINIYRKTHIAISISEIITTFIKDVDLTLSSRKIRLISDREAEIIRLLREENLDSMMIYLDKSNNIKLIETEEKYDRFDKESRLIDIILTHGYQTIELKTQDGNIVHCRNLRKIKFD